MLIPDVCSGTWNVTGGELRMIEQMQKVLDASEKAGSRLCHTYGNSESRCPSSSRKHNRPSAVCAGLRTEPAAQGEKSTWISAIERHVVDVAVAVERLRVAGVDAAVEGVGGHPAGGYGRVLAEGCMVELALAVELQAGVLVAVRRGLSIEFLAEGRELPLPHRPPARGEFQLRRAEAVANEGGPDNRN